MTENKKEEFINIYRENISRPGADKLLNYLLSDQSDFLKLPAAPDSTAHMPEVLSSIVSTSITA